MARLFARIAVILLVTVLAASAAPRQANADASGICRAITMIALAPTDFVFGPLIAAHDMHYGLTEISDPVWAQVVGFVPGYIWLLSLQAGGSVVRLASGVYEIVPGIFTLFDEGPSTPLNRSVDEAWALYSTDIGPCPIRIGTSYQTINEN